jgi:hypothetical protein
MICETDIVMAFLAIVMFEKMQLTMKLIQLILSNIIDCFRLEHRFDNNEFNF